MNRRAFLLGSAAALAAAPPTKSTLGLVRSSHPRLASPVSPEHPLDYQRVRAMVWQAIEYGGKPEIRPGVWVVVKPNLVFLRPHPAYKSGDITDLRVLRAVVEYAARHSAAARITVAEGGSYRGLHDRGDSDVITQDGRRVDALTFDWGTDEFPGFGGTLAAMLEDFRREFPGRKFDYVDLSYDAVRDAAGRFRRIPVPKSRNGVGAFSARPDYYVTNTILNCDFLIDVPVMKIHANCGVTCCLKNYVGTAPREAYALPRNFWNANLHAEHTTEDRIDHFITDLAAFHPPDYCVVDGLRGLQYSEHGVSRWTDQTVRSNLVIAGRDPVAADTLAARLIGFDPSDIEFLHQAQRREMGRMDFEVRGDDPGKLAARWAKPRNWYGRCNREWLLSVNPDSDPRGWTRHSAPGDTLDLARAIPTGAACGAAARVRADGNRKGFLWVGLRGRVTATLNGQTVLKEENRTRYRVGQFQQAVELRPGENLLVFRVEALAGEARLSALLTGPRNDGDSLDGIRWVA